VKVNTPRYQGTLSITSGTKKIEQGKSKPEQMTDEDERVGKWETRKKATL
jgi:hypothetical protein